MFNNYGCCLSVFCYFYCYEWDKGYSFGILMITIGIYAKKMTFFDPFDVQREKQKFVTQSPNLLLFAIFKSTLIIKTAVLNHLDWDSFKWFWLQSFHTANNVRIYSNGDYDKYSTLCHLIQMLTHTPNILINDVNV